VRVKPRRLTASVQLVSVFLIFASLIIPALSSRNASSRRGLLIGYGVGLVGYVVGLAASVIWNFPTGAAIICGLALTGAPACDGILTERPATARRITQLQLDRGMVVPLALPPMVPRKRG